MAKLRRVTGNQMVRFLQDQGFSLVRIRGSHHFLSHPDGRRTVVPVHSGEIIGPGLLNKILHDVEITAIELAGLL